MKISFWLGLRREAVSYTHLSGAGVEMAWQARWTQLSEELRRIGEFAQIGYKITLDANNKQYIFDTIAGTDRTAGQKERAPVIFCREYKNISEQKYTLDATAGMNIVYAGGSGEEEKQQVTKLYDGEMPAGVYRMEGFTDISSAVSYTHLLENGRGAGRNVRQPERIQGLYQE